MEITESLWILQRYSLLILPALVVAEQLGIPLPAVPALLGVGALAAAGQVSVPQVLGAIAVVALTVDLGWYELGRRRGAAVLTKICRMSLRPDAYVGRTERTFARYGAGFILVAKFVPGLTTLVPPLAGIAGIGRARFVIYEVGGVLLWAGTWLGSDTSSAMRSLRSLSPRPGWVACWAWWSSRRPVPMFLSGTCAGAFPLGRSSWCPTGPSSRRMYRPPSAVERWTRSDAIPTRRYATAHVTTLRWSLRPGEPRE